MFIILCAHGPGSVGWNDLLSLYPSNYLSVALCELFDKADTSGDGTISLEEYMVICDE